MSSDARDSSGRFATGNPGGPGRPRRIVEADYLAVMSEACPADAWRMIVMRAVEAAKRGEPKSREWLARYLLANDFGGLLKLAAWETKGGVEAEIERLAGEKS